MDTRPSIKGSAFKGVVDTLKKLVADGLLSEDELSRHLLPDERHIVDGFIGAANWYDLDTHVRVLELIQDAAGMNAIEEMGRRNARGLIESGLYQQTAYLQDGEFVKATTPQERSEALGRDLKITTTMSGMIFNFGHWVAKPDPQHPDRHLLQVSEAGPFREVHLVAVAAFLNELCSLTVGLSDLWRYRRRGTDVVEFYMSRAPVD